MQQCFKLHSILATNFYSYKMRNYTPVFANQYNMSVCRATAAEIRNNVWQARFIGCSETMHLKQHMHRYQINTAVCTATNQA